MVKNNAPDQHTLDYQLDTQVGFLLRRATQRHLAIFSGMVPDLTSTQFATLAKLCELGPTSQNALGRHTAMDAATIKGVVDRLRKKGLVASEPDPDDQRRIIVMPTKSGQNKFDTLRERAHAVTEKTLSPLTDDERTVFLKFLEKLI